MEIDSFLVALAVSYLTVTEMLEQSGLLTTIVVATTAGMVFGLLAESVQ